MDKKTINSLIGKLDKKQLLELITYIVNVNESAKKLLLEYCQKKEEDTKLDNQALIVERKLQQYWKKAAEIIEEFNLYGGGPESDEEEACDMFENITKLLENNEISWIVRKEILDEMLGLAAVDNCGFEDYLMDIAVMMCTNKQENIYLADSLIENASSYYRKVAADIYLENGEEQKFIDTKKANLQYASDYLDLAAYYEKHNDKETAIKIAWEGLDKTNGRLDNLYEYLFEYYEKNKDETALEKLYAQAEKKNRNQDTIAKLMYQYYQKKGDYKKQKKALLKLLSYCNSGEIHKWYQKCRQELSEDDFRKEESSILNTIRNRSLSVYFDIIMDKGETKEVIEYLTQNQQYGGWGIDQEHYFSKRLADIYPREIVDMYWKEVVYYVGLGKAENYNHAVSVLKEIKKIVKKNKWTDEWNDKYKAFLEKHKRKKLLLKELEGFQP